LFGRRDPTRDARETTTTPREAATRAANSTRRAIVVVRGASRARRASRARDAVPRRGPARVRSSRAIIRHSSFEMGGPRRARRGRFDVSYESVSARFHLPITTAASEVRARAVDAGEEEHPRGVGGCMIDWWMND